MDASPCFRESADGVLVTIKLQPRAGRDAIGQILGSELRVKVTAPPIDSAANDALVRLLADALDMPRRRIALLRGRTSRRKSVLLRGATLHEVQSKLPPRDGRAGSG